MAADLDRIERAARFSRRSRLDLAALRAAVAAGDPTAVWSAWFELVVGWSHGFPPHVSRLPQPAFER